MGLNPNMLRKMQERLVKMQEDLGNETVEATAGGGAIAIVMTGHQEVRSIKIDPAAVDPEDLTMLEDMLIAAVNEAVKKSKDMAEKKMASIMGGVKIPGLM